MKKNNVEKFISLIPLLEETEFIGVCKILTVSPMDNEEVKEFSLLISEIVDKFKKMDRKNRRQLLRILEKATKGRTLEEVTAQRKEKGSYVEDAADASGAITGEQNESED